MVLVSYHCSALPPAWHIRALFSLVRCLEISDNVLPAMFSPDHSVGCRPNHVLSPVFLEILIPVSFTHLSFIYKVLLLEAWGIAVCSLEREVGGVFVKAFFKMWKHFDSISERFVNLHSW